VDVQPKYKKCCRQWCDWPYSIQNKGFDANADKKISLKEISSKVRAMYEKGLSKGYLG